MHQMRFYTKSLNLPTFEVQLYIDKILQPMKRQILWIGIASICIHLNLRAQDEHFTLYQWAPLMVNPAKTGAFYGTYRVGAIFRDQAPAFGHIYRTPLFYVDINPTRGLRHWDWVSVGLNVYQDIAGTLGFEKTATWGSLAYHFALNGKAPNPRRQKPGVKPTQYLTLGIQLGNTRFSFAKLDFEDRVFEDEFNSGALSPDRLKLQNLRQNQSALAIGLMYTIQPSNTLAIRTGLSAYHLRRIQSLLQSGNRIFLPRYTAFAEADYALTPIIGLHPSLKWDLRGPSSEFNIQLMSSILFNRQKDIALLPGIGLRAGNALEFLFGLQYGPLRAALSFDLTISDLADIDNRAGAFEIALQYSGIIQKKPRPKPTLLCPRL